MRSWIICLIAACLLAPSAGCQTFKSPFTKNKDKNARKAGTFGRRDNLEQDDVLDPLGSRDSHRLLLDDLSPSQFATTMKLRTTSESGEAVAQQHYNRAEQFYNQGVSALRQNPSSGEHQQYFVEAANNFRLASAAYPDSTLQEDAVYFEGESYFFGDRYVQANRAFEKLIANYSGTRHLDQAEQRRYAMAVYWLKLAENTKAPSISDPKRPKVNIAGEARRVLHRIRINDP